MRRATLNKIKIIYAIMIITSLVMSIILALDNKKPLGYKLLPLLPIVWSLVNIIFFQLYKQMPLNIGTSLIVLLCFFRLVIIPSIMYLGEYNSLMKINISENAVKAIILLIYEIVIIYIMLYWGSRYKLQNNQRQRKKIKIGFKGFYPVLIFFTIFNIIVWILVPEFREIYRTIFEANDINFTAGGLDINNQIAVGTLKRAIITLANMSFEFIRVMVPCYIILLIHRKYGQKTKGIILSLPFVLVQFLFVSSTIARAFISAFVLLLFIGELYKSKRKNIYSLAIYSVISAVIIYFIIRFNTGSKSYNTGGIFNYLSNISMAYFSGIDNVAAIFNIENVGKWESLFFNIYGTIPFNTTLFGLSGNKLQELFNIANNSYGQIPPTIGAGYYYFGYIFAPTFSAILAYFSALYGTKAVNETNPWKYMVYIYTSLILAMGIIMYNETIILGWIISLIIPMGLVAKLTADEEYKER